MQRVIKYYDDQKTVREVFEFLDDSTSGVYTQYYRNGKVKEKSEIKHRAFDGWSITYYENGNLKSKEYYKANVQQGCFQYYYSNGNIKSIGGSEDGKRLGDYLEFSETDSGSVNLYRKYLVVDGEEVITKEQAIEKGVIVDSSPYLSINALSNDSIQIELKNSSHKNMIVVSGEFDKTFNLRDSSSLKMLHSGAFIAKIKMKKDTIRGFVSDVDIIQKDGNRFETIGTDIFFEFPARNSCVSDSLLNSFGQFMDYISMK